MGSSSRRLWETTTHTDIPRVAWHQDEWVALEEAYGKKVPDSIRDEIHNACTAYLHTRDAELHAGKAADAVAVMKQAIEAIQSFERFAHAQMSDGTDAGRAVASIIRSQLDDVTVPLNPDDVLQADAGDGELPGYFLAGERPHAALKLSDEFLSNLTVQLGQVVQRSSEEVERLAAPDGPGFEPRRVCWRLQLPNRMES